MKIILCGVMAAVLAGSTGTALAMGSRPGPEDSESKTSTIGSQTTTNASKAWTSGSQTTTNESKAWTNGSKTTASVPDISLTDLQQAIDDDSVVLLDCNGSKSYAKGHIPGSIDFESAGTDLANWMPEDKSTLVVAYCGGPKCMAYKAGAEAATKLGYSNVKHFSGGISGWQDADATVETAALCPMCGQVKGSDACCKEGAPKCEMCSMAKGSPGCCTSAKAE